MKNSQRLHPIFFLVFLLSTVSFGKSFQTDFLRFNLPEGWSCVKEEIDWVCQPDSLKQRSEALMVVVVKAVNEIDDTLEKYESILKETRELRDLAQKEYTSQVKYVSRKKIKDREWVDSLHLGSEIPGFYTRYLASINQKVAGLVTYSIAESVYPKYAEVLNAMIDSFELEFNEKAYNEAMAADPSMLPRGGLLGKATRGAPTPGDEDDAPQIPTEEGFDPIQVGTLLAAGAAIAFILWRRRKQS